jgi:NADPH-dependent ferric siderophore reductase
VIEFRVDERAFRHYTPARYDTAIGELDVIFYLHGRGLGSAWAAELATGQEALVMGPGDVGIASPTRCDWHCFLGDETAVGALHALTTALPAGATVVGAVEIEAGEEAPARELLPQLAVLTRAPGNGDALAAWLTGATLPSGRGAAYLIGHARSIQRLRDQLLARGLERRQIKSKPYWADGKRGL